MNRRIDDIRRRHSERKAQAMKTIHSSHKTSFPSRNEESGPPESNGVHPLFSGQKFIMHLLTAVVLVLAVAVIFKQPKSFPQAKQYVQQTMDQEFNFAEVSAWYQNQFGQPLAFLPSKLGLGKNSTQPTSSNPGSAYAVPVTGGKITQSFKTNGQGIYLSTKASSVEAVQDGYVTAIETKKNIGKTVIIQHTDGTETWYGDLNKVDVKMYDFVKKGDKIGTVSKSKGQQSGSFYFAIKKGKNFIDPIQVIKFD